jgi:hypothetical protein
MAAAFLQSKLRKALSAPDILLQKRLLLAPLLTSSLKGEIALVAMVSLET